MKITNTVRPSTAERQQRQISNISAVRQEQNSWQDDQACPKNISVRARHSAVRDATWRGTVIALSKGQYLHEACSIRRQPSDGVEPTILLESHRQDTTQQKTRTCRRRCRAKSGLNAITLLRSRVCAGIFKRNSLLIVLSYHFAKLVDVDATQ